MTDAFQLRRWAILALIVPLAIVLGFLLTTPFDFRTIGFVGLLLSVCLMPFCLKWHHTLLIVTWNATITLYFLPGQPDLWLVTTVLSLFIAILRKTISSGVRLTYVPLLGLPLLALGAVIVLTAIARRSIALEPGYANEVRRYFFVLVAIMGFFALSFQRIPKKQAMLYASLFFLSGTIAVLADIVFMAGPRFYFLYYLLPAGLARLQAVHEFSTTSGIFRLEGAAWASVAFSCFLLLRFGARGLLDLRRPWRMLLFLTVVAIGLLGGFRSRLLLVGLLFVLQFCFEGLWRTRWLPILLAFGVLLCCAVLPNTQKLPYPFQRALSFLPVEVDPIVRQDAEESWQWRVEMWRVVLPEVPQYLWLGKGYTHSATDHYLSQYAVWRGLVKSYDTFILTGEYHNGPLSILVPFGIWGLAAFVWLVAAGWWAMYCNYKHGENDLQKINTFLLTFYTARVVFFFVVYGAIHAELMLFTGVLGLSLAINGGVRRAATKGDSETSSKVGFANRFSPDRDPR